MKKILLIQCPAWLSETPPYGLALLTAALQKENFIVRCFDLNIELFNNIKQQKTKSDYFNTDSWNCSNIEVHWRNKSQIIRLFQENVSYVDSIIKRIELENPDFIGFSIQSTAAVFSFELAYRIKKMNGKVPIIVGGPHCFKPYAGKTILFDYPWIDMVCLTDAALSITDALDNYVQKKVTPGYIFRAKNGDIVDGSNEFVRIDLDRFSFADYSLFDLNNYLGHILPLMTSRGCINQCAFCNEKTQWQQYVTKNPEVIVAEIEYQQRLYPQIRHIWFTDLLINGDLKHLDSLCDLLISKKLGIVWDAQFVIRKGITIQVIQKMKLAGCNMLHCGLESGSSKVLRLMKKGYNSTIAKNIFSMLYSTGIKFNVNIIVGFPGENWMDFLQTTLFIVSLKKYSQGLTPSIATCIVNKGSYLYKCHDVLGIVMADGYNWYLKDKTNTLKVRTIRKEILEKIISKNIKNTFIIYGMVLVCFFKIYFRRYA